MDSEFSRPTVFDDLGLSQISAAEIAAEELRRQTAQANDARAPVETSQRNDSVLSNVMLIHGRTGATEADGELAGGAPAPTETIGSLPDTVEAKGTAVPSADTHAATTVAAQPADAPAVPTIEAALVEPPTSTSVPTVETTPVAPETLQAEIGLSAAPRSAAMAEETSQITAPTSPTTTTTDQAPIVTSAATASVTENTTGTVYTATATDADPGTTLTYSLSGTDAALFDIDPVTGAVSFKSAPDFENPQDAGGNNVYDIKVIASDGVSTTSQDVAISVTNANEGPTLTSGTTATVVENSSGPVYTATATDPDAGTTLTYSLSGDDAALFKIDAATGTVEFKASPDFEKPADAGGNNVYDVKVTASDGVNTTSQNVAISVTNANEGPTLTSGTTATVVENSTGPVYTATATDPDAGTTLTYSLSGDDAALFKIDATTGAVEFKASPDFEKPTDAGGNNVYDVKVTASDGTNSTTQDVAISVTNANEGPTLTSGTTATVIENSTGPVYTATATDPDAGTTLTYSLSGDDAALFKIDAATGAVEFKASPDFEKPADAGGNNVYDVKVTASDGVNTTSQNVAISVTNANEGPTLTSGTTATVVENSTGPVYTATATDPDAGTTLTYSLSGDDAALFKIDATTGAVEFKASPDFEKPADAGGNNVYDVKVTASDGVNTTSQNVAISVTNANEGPTLTSGTTATVVENSTGPVYTATATDPDAGTTLTYSLSGDDAALFKIDATTGAVEFKASPDFEKPADAGGNNVYDVKVTASDGTNSTTQDVAISVTNANEGPTLTSGTTATVVENSTGPVYTATATDPDAGTTLTYSLSGDDAALFKIDATTGAVAFKSAPDFEKPADAGGNNVYDVVVKASDGTNTASQNVAISVTNANEAPTITTVAASPTQAAAAQSEIVLHVSGDQYQGSPLMRVSVDGVVVGTYAVTADHHAGGWQDVRITGDFGAAGPGAVKVEFTNDAYGGSGATDRNLVVDNITVNGAKFEAEQANYTVGSSVMTGYEVMPWQGYLTFNTAGSSPGTAYTAAENNSGTVFSAKGTDPDAGTKLTYSLSGTDAALFKIDADTGAVSFKSAPDYEHPADAGGNNVYNVVVSTSDGTNTASQAVAIAVTNVNEAPTVTSATTANVAENSTGTVYTATATDPDAGTTLTYSLSGTDAALFKIDATTGAVSFKSSPDFEHPTDAGGNNVYDVKVVASDGTNSTSQNVAISVTNVNEAPTLTSATTATVAENSAGTVYTAAATDPDAGTTLTYSLSGTDAALFKIDATTGAVSFKSAPDFEHPTDAGGNNVYDVKVTASDGTNSTSQNVAISVTNVNEAPVVTATGVAVRDVVATSEFEAGSPSTGWTGVSGSSFDGWTMKSGGSTFEVVGSHFAGTDNGTHGSAIDLAGSPSNVVIERVFTGLAANETYVLSFRASSGGSDGSANIDDNAIGVTINGATTGVAASDLVTGYQTFTFSFTTDASGTAKIQIAGVDPTPDNTGAFLDTVTLAHLDTSSSKPVAENALTGTIVGSVTGIDPDAGDTLTYSLTDNAGGRFAIDSATGQITVADGSKLDYETATSHTVTVHVTDAGGLSADKILVVAVGNVNEAPTITSSTAVAVAENATGTVYTAAATDPDAGTTLSYAISGTDAALFNIDAATGAVSFKSAPDYETPLDAGGNNVYDIKVIASDGVNATSQDVAISITNVSGSFTGTSGNDSIIGTAEEDIIFGGAGNDTLNGGAGNDILIGGAGADIFIGGAGIDTVDYSSATAGIIVALQATDGSGIGQAYTNTAAGGYAGDATGDTFSGVENLIGTDYADKVYGGASSGTYSLGGGDDVFDTDHGLTHANIIDMGSGNDTAWSGDGNDTVFGGTGNDSLYGEVGNDTIEGGAGADKLDGGAGIDTVSYSADTVGVTVNLSTNTASGGDAAGDTIVSFENITGGSGNDTLTGDGNANILTGGAGDDTLSGGAGNDTLYGGTGNDTLAGGAGADFLDGGAGTNTLSYSASTAGVTVNLALGTAIGGDATGDTFSHFQNITGSAFADTLTGDSGANVLIGGAGNDTLFGGGGNDTLTGDAGSDLFIMQAGHGHDVVTGGAGGGWIDSIELRDASGASYSGSEMPSDWTLVLTSGHVTGTSGETLNLSDDSAGYIQHTDGTQVAFSEIEQIRW